MDSCFGTLLIERRYQLSKPDRMTLHQDPINFVSPSVDLYIPRQQLILCNLQITIKFIFNIPLITRNVICTIPILLETFPFTYEPVEKFYRYL